MWKSRVSSTPPRPTASTTKLLNPALPAKLIRSTSARSNDSNTSVNRSYNNNHNSRQNISSSFTSNNNNNNNASIVNRRARSPSPNSTLADGTLLNNNNNNNNNNNRANAPRTPSPRTATTNQDYWGSLARPRSPHLQLRGEISSLRCKIQKTELEMNARAAEQAKYKRIEKLFVEAKKTRNDQKNLQAARNFAANSRKQSLWQEAQEQHHATKLRMAKLFHERQTEVHDTKQKMGQIRAESQNWRNSNMTMQVKQVQDLRETRQISKLQAAATHARQVQNCRNEFNRDVGDVTKQLKQYHDVKVAKMRNQIENERAASADRRTNAKREWMQTNVNAREETRLALDRAKKIDAKMLLDERRQLLAFEKKILQNHVGR